MTKTLPCLVRNLSSHLIPLPRVPSTPSRATKRSFMTDDGLCLVESNPTPPRPTIHPTLFDVEGMIGRRWNSKGKVKSMPGFDRRSKRAGPFPSTPQFSSLRHSHSAKTDRPSDIVRRRRIDGDIGRFVCRAASREGGTKTTGGEGGRGRVAPR